MEKKTEKTMFYDFYKSPDSEDCLQKTYYATKYTGTAGVIVGLIDIGANSFPRTIIGGIYRMLNFAPVYAMMGFSMASTVCIASKLRQKDDFFNHALGAAVAGSVYGAKCGSAVMGGRIGLLFAIPAVVVKYMRDNDYPLIKIRTKQYDIYNPHFDFTIKMYKDPGRPLDT